MKTVCHITSAHPADDIRIFHKECMSLAAAGYTVHIVAKGQVPKMPGNIIHHPLEEYKGKGRISRMFRRSFQAYRLARLTKASIFHFHDPELLPYGLLLKWQGHTVIYDAHEDVPRDIMMKDWIPGFIRKSIAFTMEHFENFVARRMDTVIAATGHIAARFKSIGAKSVTIHNFPKQDELCLPGLVNEGREDIPSICYIGLISIPRGIIEMIKAIENLPVRLILAGPFIDDKTEKMVSSLPGWYKVDYRGVVSRQEVANILAESTIGLCLLHPTPTFLESLPIKLFEYMSASLPVVCSNFSGWSEMMNRVQCGLMVDPLSIQAIGQAIEMILSNNQEARQQGLRGRKAVLEVYNWESEVKKMLGVYREVR